MTTETSKAKASPDGQIRELIDNWAKAVRAKDVNGAMSSYAPDILTFDAITPLQSIGSDAARKRTEEWFASFQGAIDCELRDLSVTADETAAFSHSLNRFTGTKTDGEKIDMWVRATICFQKVGGQWLVTHQHISAPFDPESGKASLDLKP